MSNFVPGRRGYEYFTQDDFRGGINHEEENAVPGQVLEARNVWSPLGRPETRPGYFGINQFTAANLRPDDIAAAEDIVLASEVTASSTFVFAPFGGSLALGGFLAQNAAQLGDSWYIGFPALTYPVVLGTGNTETFTLGSALVVPTVANTANVGFKAQYWNGATFTYFPSVIEAAQSPFFGFPLFPATFPTLSGFSNFSFVVPADWESTLLPTPAVGNANLFWIKFTLFDMGAGAISAGTTLSTTAPFAPIQYLAQGQMRGNLAAQLPAQRLYVYAMNGLLPGPSPVPTRYYTKADDVRKGNQFIYFDLNGETPSREPATFAVISQFNVIYCANDYEMTEFRPGLQADRASIDAVVEDNPEFVGPGAPYDKRILLQASAFPKCKFIMWYQGLLWLANIQGKEYQIKWSASTGALEGGIFDGYRVFPDETTFANIEDDDNSPITGMSSLNEQALIFKNNSIWRMVAAGTKDNKLALFQPVKVSNGVGCISNQSIGKTPLGLMFLGEDGVYLFDGVRTSKMTVAIDDTIHTMTYPAAHLAAGVTWRDNNVYFLSLPIAGAAENNTIIAFDYKYVMRSNEGGIAPAIWIFDNVPAQTWMLDEGESDLEILYFFDSKGAQYQLDYRQHDNGAPTISYAQTHRQGFGDFITKSARELRVNASNNTDALEYELVGDDRNYGSDGPLSFFDFAETPIEGAVFDVDPFSRRARRERRVAVRENGEWFTVKVSNDTKNQRMQLHRISVGYVRKGPR